MALLKNHPRDKMQLVLEEMPNDLHPPLRGKLLSQYLSMDKKGHNIYFRLLGLILNVD